MLSLFPLIFLLKFFAPDCGAIFWRDFAHFLLQLWRRTLEKEEKESCQIKTIRKKASIKLFILKKILCWNIYSKILYNVRK